MYDKIHYKKKEKEIRKKKSKNKNLYNLAASLALMVPWVLLVVHWPSGAL